MAVSEVEAPEGSLPSGRAPERAAMGRSAGKFA